MRLYKDLFPSTGALDTRDKVQQEVISAKHRLDFCSSLAATFSRVKLTLNCLAIILPLVALGVYFSKVQHGNYIAAAVTLVMIVVVLAKGHAEKKHAAFCAAALCAGTQWHLWEDLQDRCCTEDEAAVNQAIRILRQADRSIFAWIALYRGAKNLARGKS